MRLGTTKWANAFHTLGEADHVHPISGVLEDWQHLVPKAVHLCPHALHAIQIVKTIDVVDLGAMMGTPDHVTQTLHAGSITEDAMKHDNREICTCIGGTVPKDSVHLHELFIIAQMFVVLSMTSK